MVHYVLVKEVGASIRLEATKIWCSNILEVGAYNMLVLAHFSRLAVQVGWTLQQVGACISLGVSAYSRLVPMNLFWGLVPPIVWLLQIYFGDGASIRLAPTKLFWGMVPPTGWFLQIDVIKD